MYDTSDKDGAVRAIQTYLLELHYDTGNIPFIIVDGVFGTDTKEAVTAFQRGAGLPESGAVDRTTWDRLYTDYRRALAKRSATHTIPPDTPLPLGIGAGGVGVRSLQRLLNALGQRYGLSVRTDISGVYSYASEAVTNALRQIYRMPQDGTVTGELFEKMIRDYQYPARPVE